MDKIPLLVTRFSLSPRTAIGVQTKLLVSALSEWRHVFWSRHDLGRHDGRSISLESIPCSRLSILQKPTRLASVARQLNISWWKNDQLTNEKAVRALKALKEKTSVIYAAPIDAADARRMCSIIRLVKAPFVIHLWDLLDATAETCSELRWLLVNAHRVCYLSEAMLSVILPFRKDADQLRFCRQPSDFAARHPSGSELKIALIGDVASYCEGVGHLSLACEILQAKGILPRLQYIGPPSVLKKVNHPFIKNVEPLGFARSNEHRDSLLSKCHVGFLPGPSKDPELDNRSKYSMPSRILDFWANGLPVAAFVHSRSATATLIEQMSMSKDCRSILDTGTQIASYFESLFIPQQWQTENHVSTRSFKNVSAAWPPHALKKILLEAADVGSCTFYPKYSLGRE